MNSGPMNDDHAFTEDGFLGRRLRLKQPRRGHRAGHDAILLAAATPAAGGDRVVDLGAGVGAAGLAVAARVGGIDLVLVERDESLVALAESNLRANGVSGRAVALDVTAPAQAFAVAELLPDSVDRILMNPPFNDAGHLQASPDPLRRVAHEADGSTLERWVHTARRLLKNGGTLSLIWRADELPLVFGALARGFGGLAVLPVHARAETSALRVLIRATKGSAAPVALLPGLILQDESGQMPPAMRAVFNGDSGLPLASATG